MVFVNFIPHSVQIAHPLYSFVGVACGPGQEPSDVTKILMRQVKNCVLQSTSSCSFWKLVGSLTDTAMSCSNNNLNRR